MKGMEDLAEKTFIVPEISCAHCVRAISDELNSIQGVEVLNIDIGEKTVEVRYEDTVVEDQIVAGIEDAGYEIAGTRA
jgi:copper chaperone